MTEIFMKIIIGLLLAGISLQLFLIHNLNSTYDKYWIQSPSVIQCGSFSRRPVVIFPDNIGKSLPVVKGVFTRLGYEAQFISNHDNTANWDVMWHSEYPFKDPVLPMISSMTSNQKINHYPGIAYIGRKSVFNTLNGGTKYTPKTFEMPKQKQQFLEEIKGKSGIDGNRVWIQKNLGHRGNIVKPIKDLDLDQPGLIQEFIKNQFLLHGHVINIGINVIITSIFPLRAYILDNAWMIRICNKPFHPIDYTDINTYVTDGDHMSRSLFDFPPMKRYFDAAYSRKQALLAYVRSELGKDPSKIEDQIYDAIQDTLIKRRHLLKVTPVGKSIGPHSSYFEVMRWDFILDDDLNIHLIEANMSPNIANRQQVLILQKNEQLIYNTLSAIGFTNGGGNHHGLRDRNTFVDLEICYTTLCDGRCDLEDCLPCSSCLSKYVENMLRGSYAEHINRQTLRAVYPPRMTQMYAQHGPMEAVRNGLHDEINKAWLRAKCIADIHWCT